MKVRFALIPEGSTEGPLVPILEDLCRRAGASDVTGLDAKELLERHEAGKKLTRQVQTVVRVQTEINLLFIHRDADGPSDSLVRQQIDAMIAPLTVPHTVALVPIQETEAWLLCDERVIRRVAGNPNGRAPLDLPKIKQIEGCSSPKERLRQALVAAAKPGRQQQEIRTNSKIFGKLRRRLLEGLDIDGDVNHLSAWQRLLTDIENAVTLLALEQTPEDA